MGDMEPTLVVRGVPIAGLTDQDLGEMSYSDDYQSYLIIVVPHFVAASRGEKFYTSYRAATRAIDRGDHRD